MKAGNIYQQCEDCRATNRPEFATCQRCGSTNLHPWNQIDERESAEGTVSQPNPFDNVPFAPQAAEPVKSRLDVTAPQDDIVHQCSDCKRLSISYTVTCPMCHGEMKPMRLTAVSEETRERVKRGACIAEPEEFYRAKEQCRPVPRFEQDSDSLRGLLLDACTLMPLGTAIRAEWLKRAHAALYPATVSAEPPATDPEEDQDADDDVPSASEEHERWK